MKEVTYHGAYLTVETKITEDDLGFVRVTDRGAGCKTIYGEGSLGDLIDGLEAADLVMRFPPENSTPKVPMSPELVQEFKHVVMRLLEQIRIGRATDDLGHLLTTNVFYQAAAKYL